MEVTKEMIWRLAYILHGKPADWGRVEHDVYIFPELLCFVVCIGWKTDSSFLKRSAEGDLVEQR